MGFLEIIQKIVRNYPMKSNSHFSGKWQNRQISQLLGIGKSEVIILHMEVTLVNDYQYAHNTISLSNLKPLLRLEAEMKKPLLLK